MGTGTCFSCGERIALGSHGALDCIKALQTRVAKYQTALQEISNEACICPCDQASKDIADKALK